MKNSIIHKTSLSGANSLEEVSHLDIFGDMSGIPVRGGDMCFVIPDGGPSSVYIARKKEAIADPPYTIVMTSGGDFVWECSFVVDNTECESIKAVRVSEDSPIGFSRVMSGLYYAQKYRSGYFPQLNYPLSFTCDNMAYALKKFLSYTYIGRCDLTSCNAVSYYTNYPAPSVQPCGCYDNGIYYLFNTSTNSVWVWIVRNSYWRNTPTSIPGPSRSDAAAVLCGGFVYLFGGGDVSYLDIYKYDPMLDINPGTPGAYVLEGTLPYHVSAAFGAAIGDKLYIFSGIDPIKTLVYDTVAKTWDTSVPDYFPAGIEELAYTTLFHKTLGKFLFLLMDDTTGLRTLLIVYFDPVTKTFGELCHHPMSYDHVYPGVTYNEDTGTISVITSDSQRVVEIKPITENLLIED
jgi:hypothetical protein